MGVSKEQILQCKVQNMSWSVHCQCIALQCPRRKWWLVNFCVFFFRLDTRKGLRKAKCLPYKQVLMQV
jgi:hypothetical protein